MGRVFCLLVGFLISGAAVGEGLPTKISPQRSYYIDFGIMRPGQFATESVWYQNNGTTPLQNLHIYNWAYDYRVYHNCPSTLPPRARCSIQIQFSSYGPGYYSGQMEVRSQETYDVFYLRAQVTQ